MLKAHDVAQRSDEWFKLRDGLVTASNAYILLRYGKAAAIKANGRRGDSFAMWRGRTLEDEAISLYEQIEGVKVKRIGFYTNTDYPGGGYSPDGVVKRINLEVKCFNQDKHLGVLNGDTLRTPETIAQIQFGLMLTNRKICHLIIYNPDLGPKEAIGIIEIKRDEEIIKRLKEALSG